MTVHTIDKETIYSYLGEINDPEVPVLTVLDLGIVRDVQIKNDQIELLKEWRKSPETWMQ